MQIEPIRFIGHKIGPFDHIELNWEPNSQHTLIVAENGMGKTTLVAAMAACLSFGDNTLFPLQHFQRFCHDEESFAYFEIKVEDTSGWLLRWGPQSHRGFFGITPLGQLGDFYYVFRPGQGSMAKVTPSNSTIVKPQALPELEGAIIFIETFTPDGLPVLQGACSYELFDIFHSWHFEKDVHVLAAAYGVNRNLQQTQIQEQQKLEEAILENILCPFQTIPSGEILQWITDQHINRLVALDEHNLEEATSYLDSIQRIENIFTELEYPLTFQLKRNPLRLRIQQNDNTLSVDQLSDGTRSFLSWPLDYLARASRIHWAEPQRSSIAPGIILVDEIDAHLHPEWQRRVMPSVAQLLPQTHIIATTHSPFVVGSSDDTQVFQIDKDAQGKLNVVSHFDTLYGYPADLVLKKIFIPNLYPPAIEKKLNRLNVLARGFAAGTLTPTEEEEHTQLLQTLREFNPWLDNLLTLSQGHLQ